MGTWNLMVLGDGVAEHCLDCVLLLLGLACLDLPLGKLTLILFVSGNSLISFFPSSRLYASSWSLQKSQRV